MNRYYWQDWNNNMISTSDVQVSMSLFVQEWEQRQEPLRTETKQESYNWKDGIAIAEWKEELTYFLSFF